MQNWQFVKLKTNLNKSLGTYSSIFPNLELYVHFDYDVTFKSYEIDLGASIPAGTLGVILEDNDVLCRCLFPSKKISNDGRIILEHADISLLKVDLEFIDTEKVGLEFMDVERNKVPFVLKTMLEWYENNI